MALKVVIDTNIVVCTRGRLLQGPEMEAIESVRQRLSLTVVLPAIVKAEAVNLYREDLHKRVGELRKNWQSVSDILPLGGGPLGADFSEENAVRAYEESLTRRLDEIGAECPLYDGIPHQWIVDRILRRRKPFNEKTGAGYRDALLSRSLRNALPKDTTRPFSCRTTRTILRHQEKETSFTIIWSLTSLIAGLTSERSNSVRP